MYLQSNLPKHQTNVNNNDKKSSSSSISSAYSGSQSQSQSQLNNSLNKLNVLTPINSLETYNSNSNNNLSSPKQSIKSQSRTPSTGRQGEFFPPHLDPNNNVTTNTEYITVKNAKTHNSQLEEDRTAKEVRDSLRLDFRKNNNHLTVNNYENDDDLYNDSNTTNNDLDNEVDDDKFNNDDDYNELDNGDQDQLKVLIFIFKHVLI
jgi:hypothetical protein